MLNHLVLTTSIFISICLLLIYFEGHGFISILYRQVPASKNKFYYYYYRHAHSAQWHFQWLPIYALIFADGCIFLLHFNGALGISQDIIIFNQDLFAFSLRKHPFLLALYHQRCFARMNVCNSAAEIAYWWPNPMFT